MPFSTRLGEKIKGSALLNIPAYWRVPPAGNSVPFREVAAYSVGGMGVQLCICLFTSVSLSVGNTLIGNTIGITPMDLQKLNIIATVLGFGITALRSYIIDNTRAESGKFRPYLFVMGIPTVIFSTLMVWMPYDSMSYIEKFWTVLVFYILLQMCSPFYQTAYTNLAQVMSPNTYERTSILSVSSVVSSFAPTLYNIIIPVLCKYTGGLTSIYTYRYIYPPICLTGVLFGYFAYFGTRERIVQPASSENRAAFLPTLREVMRNKYFWIISLGGWIGFLESAFGVLLLWSFEYGKIASMNMYALLTTIIGNAALWSMLLSPIAVRKLGKRRLLILINLANVVIIGLLYFGYARLWSLVALFYLNGFVNSFTLVLTPSIEADMRDYQQYISGRRIDGMFGIMGIIGSVIGMFTGLVLPKIYELRGLVDDYSVLYNADIRNGLMRALIVAAVVGAALNVIPYFFYDLTEKKQKGIVKVLCLRAMYDDFAAGDISDEELVRGVDIINETRLFADKRRIPDTRGKLSKTDRLFNDSIDIAEFTAAEIDKHPETAEITALYDDAARRLALKREAEELEAQRLARVRAEELERFKREKRGGRRRGG